MADKPGSYTSNNFFYKPSLDASYDTDEGKYQRDLFEASLQIADTQIKALVDSATIFAVVIKTSSYSIIDSDCVVVCNSSSAMTISLPNATGSGKSYEIKNINSGAVVINNNSAHTIDLIATQTINQWDAIKVIDYSIGKWAII